MIYLFVILIIIIAYFYGCFSTARIVAKSFRSLNVYKIGTGLADTENIYTNISKPLGTLVGAIDVAKASLFLLVVEFLLGFIDIKVINYPDFTILYSENLMLIYGLSMLIGHCLPLTHRFRELGWNFYLYGDIRAFLQLLFLLLLHSLLVYYFSK